MKRLFYILFCLALLGCNTQDDAKKPANLIPEGEMVRILADIHVMESVIEANVPNSDTAMMVYNREHKAILEKHGITRDQFYTTYNYYGDNLELMDKLYETVLDTLTAREAKLASKSGTPADQGSTLPEEEKLEEPVRRRDRLMRPQDVLMNAPEVEKEM